MNSIRNGLAHINWRREAIYPALAVAEICLITPWALTFIPHGNRFAPEVAARANLVLILGTLYLVRAMNALHVNTQIQRAVILLSMVGAILLAWRLIVFSGPEWTGWSWIRALPSDLISLSNVLPGELVVALGVILLFWRGLRLAHRPLNTFDVMIGLQVGIVLLALFILINTLTSEQDVTIYIPPFFFSQLLALGLTRVETIWQERGGRVSPFKGWWLATLVGSTGLVILLAGAISVAVLGIGPDRLLFWMGPFLAIITLPIALVLLPILALLGIIAEALARALLNFQWPTIVTRFSPSSPSGDATIPPAVRTALQVIGHALRFGKGALTVLLVLAALAAVLLIIGRWRASQQGLEGERHESIWSGRSLLQRLRAQMQRRLARLRNLTNIAGRFGAGGLFTALTIRRIYAQTVRLAASRGYPRPPARTPYEHLITLQQAIPGCSAELAQITEAYVGVHYGELPEQPDALAEIRAAFERVKTQATEVKSPQTNPSPG